jgi:NADPH:quinone reductase-like Zn-dependent oxidoreductase
VILNPGLSCGVCEYCREGDDPLCLRFGILGEHFPGTLADQIVVPAINAFRIPDELSFIDAAAFPLATLTAWRMVVTRAKVKAGDDVLIWGIGGGVAQQALQICKLLGARVWVTSGSQDKLERARALGADVLLDHSAGDVGKEVRAQTGKRGVDVVIDSVGEATWKQSLGALGKRGRLVTCGGTTGPTVPVSLPHLFIKNQSILGSTMGPRNAFAAILDRVEKGVFRPVLDRVMPLSRIAEAHDLLESRKVLGKIVLTPGS